MNILIIGGTRFVGLAVAKRLKQSGHCVALFHRAKRDDLPFAQFAGDLNNAASLRICFETFMPDCIIHMYAMNSGNIDTLKCVLSDFDGENPRVVVISSADVYRGFEVVNKLSKVPIQPIPFTETSPLRDMPLPFGNDYEKKDVEKSRYSIGAICVRLGMVYGENDYQKRFTDVFDAIQNNYVITLPQDMANWRSCYIGVNNAAHGIALLTEDGKTGEVYNLAGDEILTELQWREKIAKLLNQRGKIVVSDKTSDDFNFAQDLILDTAKIKAAVGYSDIHTTEEELMKCPRK